MTVPSYVIYGDCTDSELIDLSVQGDKRAFDAFARRHERMIHQFCIRLTSNMEDARDLLQDVLLKVWRGLGHFDRRSTLSTWIYRIVFNAAVDNHRVFRPVPMDVLTVNPYLTVHSHLSVNSHENSVTQSYVVREALAKLPAPYRVTVVLADCMQCSYDEIAEICEVNVGTVKSRLARGRAAMRDLLGPAGGA